MTDLEREVPPEFFEQLGRLAEVHAYVHYDCRLVLGALLGPEIAAVKVLTDGQTVAQMSKTIRRIVKYAVKGEDHAKVLIAFVDDVDRFSHRRNRLLHSMYQIPLHNPGSDAETRGVRLTRDSISAADVEGVSIAEVQQLVEEMDTFVRGALKVVVVACEAYNVMENDADAHYGRPPRHPELL